MERRTETTMIAGALFMVALLLFGYGTAYAETAYKTSFENTYPAAKGSPIDACTLCHPSGSGPRNPYGTAYGNSGHNFKTIESLDSDGDTFSNITEIKDWSNPGVATSKPKKPVVTAFAIPATSSSLVVPIKTFTATDNVKVTGYKLTKTSTKPTASSTGWKATKPASYTFAAPGTKTLYAWAKDKAGLVSASKKATVTITALAAAPSAAGAVGTPASSLTSASASASLMPLPAGQESFTFAVAELPVRSADPAGAMPIGVSQSGKDGDTLEIMVSIGEFEGPVDIYFTVYAPEENSFAPVAVYSLQPDNTIRPVDMGQAETAEVYPWKTNVTGADETVLSSLDGLPHGQYMVVLTVTNADNENVYYEWMTNFTVR